MDRALFGNEFKSKFECREFEKFEFKVQKISMCRTFDFDQLAPVHPSIDALRGSPEPTQQTMPAKSLGITDAAAPSIAASASRQSTFDIHSSPGKRSASVCASLAGPTFVCWPPRDIDVTEQPHDTSALQTWLPINPEPPTTAMRVVDAVATSTRIIEVPRRVGIRAGPAA